MRHKRRKRASRYEIRVWREDGFSDGDPIAWRAQVYVGRDKPVSPIGIGSTAEAASADAREVYAQSLEERARAEATVHWVPL